MIPATEEDWGREYLDAMISVKIVDSLEEAIDHINRYNTGHSETIVTENYDHALKFLDEVDGRQQYMSTHRPDLRMDSNSDSEQRLESVPRNYMRGVRWDWKR